MPWLDILVIVFLLLFLVIGLIRGFWKTFISLFSSLIVLVIAILLAKPCANLVDSLFGLGGSIANSLQPTFADYFTSAGYTSGWIGRLLIIIMGQEYMSTLPADQTEAVTQLSTDFSANVGHLISVLICVVVLYIILRIVLFLLAKLLNRLTEGKVMKTIDRILGAILGVVKGAFYVFAVMGAVFFLGSFITPLGSAVENLLSNCYVANTLYSWTEGIIQNILIPFFLG